MTTPTPFEDTVKFIAALSKQRGDQVNLVSVIAQACVPTKAVELKKYEGPKNDRVNNVIVDRLRKVSAALHLDAHKTEISKQVALPHFNSVSKGGTLFNKVLTAVNSSSRVSRRRSNATTRDYFVTELFFIADVSPTPVEGVTFVDIAGMKEAIEEREAVRIKCAKAENAIMSSLNELTKAFAEKKGVTISDDDTGLDTDKYALINEDSIEILKKMREFRESAFPTEEQLEDVVTTAVQETKEFRDELKKDTVSADDICGTYEQWRRATFYWWMIPIDCEANWIKRGTKAKHDTSRYYYHNVNKIMQKFFSPEANTVITLVDVLELCTKEIKNMEYLNDRSPSQKNTYSSPYNAFKRFIAHAKSSTILQLLNGLKEIPDGFNEKKYVTEDVRAVVTISPKSKRNYKQKSQKRVRDYDSSSDDSDDSADDFVKKLTISRRKKKKAAKSASLETEAAFVAGIMNDMANQNSPVNSNGWPSPSQQTDNMYLPDDLLNSTDPFDQVPVNQTAMAI